MIIDKDFYGDSVPYKLSELIKKVQTLFPDLYHSNSILKDVSIESCATIQKANKQDLVFIENPKYIKYLENIKVGCIVIDPKHSTLVNNKNSFLICKMPRRIFAFCLSLISPGDHLPVSESNISNVLELRCFHMINEVAFSRMVVLINVGFWLHIIVLVM